jgi:dTMP kinase
MWRLIGYNEVARRNGNMGLFVSLEGIDGSGKSTITKLVKEHFEALNEPIVVTREPGGNVIAEKIRDIILDNENHTMDDRTEALLYAASRRQHLIEKILPALEEGKLVVCDRFVDSSIAYQGYGRQIGAQAVRDINAFAIEGHMPHLTIFLDVDLDTGLSRIDTRGEMDRLETSGRDFFQRVYQGYQEIMSHNERVVKVDASRDLELVIKEVIEIIESRWF